MGAVRHLPSPMQIRTPLALFFGSLGSLFGVAPVFIANAAIMTAGGLLSRGKPNDETRSVASRLK